MVRKIISGGQTGADRAALDFAIKFGIPHGGWIARGRKAEDGTLHRRYQLQETPEPSYLVRTEKNVLESDGTLIVSHGILTGGSDYTRKVAVERNRPWIHIDLDRVAAFQAAERVSDWVAEKHIEVLNVAGPRQSKDRSIYKAVFDLLETAFFLSVIEDRMPRSTLLASNPNRPGYSPPGGADSVESAADAFIPYLSFKERTKIANLPENKLHRLGPEILTKIIGKFQLHKKNSALLRAIGESAGEKNLSPEEAAEAILRAVCQRLGSKKNILRIIK